MPATDWVNAQAWTNTDPWPLAEYITVIPGSAVLTYAPGVATLIPSSAGLAFLAANPAGAATLVADRTGTAAIYRG